MTKEGKEDQENVEDPARKAVEMRRAHIAPRPSLSMGEAFYKKAFLTLIVCFWPGILFFLPVYDSYITLLIYGAGGALYFVKKGPVFALCAPFFCFSIMVIAHAFFSRDPGYAFLPLIILIAGANIFLPSLLVVLAYKFDNSK